MLSNEGCERMLNKVLPSWVNYYENNKDSFRGKTCFSMMIEIEIENEINFNQRKPVTRFVTIGDFLKEDFGKKPGVTMFVKTVEKFSLGLLVSDNTNKNEKDYRLFCFAPPAPLE